MLNYLQMSRLASSLTGLDLGAMLRAHIPGVLLTLAVAGAALVTRGVLLGFHLPAPIVLLVCAAAAGLAAIVSCDSGRIAYLGRKVFGGSSACSTRCPAVTPD